MNRLLAIAAAAALAGCAPVGPNYEKPALAAPAAWSGAPETAPAELAAWWTRFGDPALDRLVADAAAGNLDLRQAAARLREARENAVAAGSSLWPSAAAGGSGTRSRATENGFGPTPPDPEHSLFKAGFDATWELDLFGGARRGVEAAEADAGAAAEDRRAVMVSLLGEVVRNYVELRGAQRQLAIVRDQVAAARGVVELTRARLAAGLSTELDLARAESLASSTEAGAPPLEVLRRRAVHRLGVLCGKPPAALAAALEADAPIPALPPTASIGLPSELLARRPDLRRAERQLAAATARIGVAVADLYPKFSLTGALGLESIRFGDLLDASSRTWSLGGAVRLPLFDRRKLRAAVSIREARASAAASAYELAFLVALEEVENALAAASQESRRATTLRAAEESSAKASRLARDLHDKGLVSFFDVLETERGLFQAQSARAQSEAQLASAVVALYKSLGGGWEAGEAED